MMGDVGDPPLPNIEPAGGIFMDEIEVATDYNASDAPSDPEWHELGSMFDPEDGFVEPEPASAVEEDSDVAEIIGEAMHEDRAVLGICSDEDVGGGDGACECSGSQK